MSYQRTHGHRSSFRDWAAEETDHPREIIEAALAHVVRNKVEAAYARSDLVNHPSDDVGSTLRRQLGILVDVHSVLLPGNGWRRTISFLGRGRVDNPLKDHSWQPEGG